MVTFNDFILFYIVFTIVLLLIPAIPYIWIYTYKRNNKKLAVKYAELVYKKYNNSRSKIAQELKVYLWDVIRINYPNVSINKVDSIRERVFKQWYKSLIDSEIELARYNPRFRNTINLKDLKCGKYPWFLAKDKLCRMAFLRKVILDNKF